MSSSSTTISCGDPDGSSSTEATMSDDVCTEILTRLPLKSLFRFSCVSKSWNGLISDDHLRRRRPLLMSALFHGCSDDGPRFACTSGGDLQECSLEFFPFRRSSAIIDCGGGGLLLLADRSLPSTLYVVSPITKRWVALPKPPGRPSTGRLSVLAFDPCHSSKFKVVSFVGWAAEGAELEVFSSETGQWVERRVQWGISSGTMTARLRYFAGILYILTCPNYVVAFDVDENSCRLIELPESVKPEGRIDRSAGVLHYAGNDGGQLKIWMHKEEPNICGWVLKHSIDVNAAVHGHQLAFSGLHPEREVVYLRAPGKLVSYDARKKEVEEVCEFEEEREKACVVDLRMFPFSRHMLDCLISQIEKGRRM